MDYGKFSNELNMLPAAETRRTCLQPMPRERPTCHFMDHNVWSVNCSRRAVDFLISSLRRSLGHVAYMYNIYHKYQRTTMFEVQEKIPTSAKDH